MIEFVKDPNTLLLLHGENFADSSGNGHSITNNGVTISTSQSKFGGSSFYFDGGSYIKADISGAKTVDFWLYTNTATASGKYPIPFSMSLSGVRTNVQIDDSTSSAYPVYRVIINNAVSGGNGSTVISRGTWHHLAYCYDGNGTHSFYLDGVLQKQFNASVGDYAYLVLGVAMNYDGTFDANTYFTGYIDEIRVSDVVRWTEDFTPPTEPYPDSSIEILPGGVLPIQYALRRRMMINVSKGLPISDLSLGTLLRIADSDGGQGAANYEIADINNFVSGGVVLVRKNIHSKSEFGSSTYYPGSTLDNTMTSIYNSLPEKLQSKIMDATFALVDSDSITRKVFALTYTMAGFGNNLGVAEGKAFQHYNSNANRIKTYSGSAGHWWLSSRYNTSNPRLVTFDGAASRSDSPSPFGVVPAFVIPANAVYGPTPNADGSYNLIY